ncbi:MAG: indolepyruvate ferredoxin oxidoreductase family protein [Proteobacteria bacterium]|nr:indolepyruvate ferredoxin oxidoreductase family protein [Pseudomonadota bacterium]
MNIKNFKLENRYTQEEGKVVLTGTQALIRIPLDQHRADKKRGLKTATFISGYRGSPLGNYDITLQKNKKLLQEHDIKFVPGVNEELAATAIFGSQMAHSFPKPLYDGVSGIWYGKGPGVDRTGDIFKHANITGVDPLGGVLAIAGDDPTAKSSTIPSHSEIALFDAQMPILYPGNVQEVLDFGRLGLELSRFCGSWVGLKFVTNVADEFGQAQVSADRIQIITPVIKYGGTVWRPKQNPLLLAPYSLNQEKEIVEQRLDAAREFARINNLNQISGSTSRSKTGIIAAGKTYYDLKEALLNLGFDGPSLAKKGVRILKLGLIYPLDQEILFQFSDGLEEILIVEEKRSFIELFVKDILYPRAERPEISGKKDRDGKTLVRADFELDAGQLTEVLNRWNPGLFPLPEDIEASLILPDTPLLPGRSPYFCSGCPHNSSTKVPENSIVGGGIGCHTLSIMMDRNIKGLTQMGGEGAQWVGTSPFTKTSHIFQNIGDGTLFHSGTLAIRQAVSSDVNITYKILYNSTVAMTGGQLADGEIPVPDLTRLLEAEGVQQTIIVTPYPNQYNSASRWARNVDILHRDKLLHAQNKLQKIKGVTALIYDQECAAELRRKRKRGLIDSPDEHLFINPEICEDCGDCTVQSNCLSLFPQITRFGRKIQVDQSSCNYDYSCLKGDCPSWLSVHQVEENVHDKARISNTDVLEKYELPNPAQNVAENCNIYIMGVGGTGVVTINQILATAAFLESKFFKAFDQTGLSQKGGSVVSHLKLYESENESTNMIGKGKADIYLAFDLVTALNSQNLSKINPETTAIISCSQVPTGSMIFDKAKQIPGRDQVETIFDSLCKTGKNHYFDANQLAVHFLGSHLFANMISVGVAFQSGCLPIKSESIEQAIKINGVAVENNLRAFRLGRHTLANNEEVLAGLTQDRLPKVAVSLPVEIEKAISLIGFEDQLLDQVMLYVKELADYQNREFALGYLQKLNKICDMISDFSDKNKLLSIISEHLFKLMRVKDEYEIARIHLKHSRPLLQKQFGRFQRYAYYLHPPILRRFGLKGKLKLGKWIETIFYVLEKLKFVRGTYWDPFSHSELRNIEKTLVDGYFSLLMDNLQKSSPALNVELAGLPSIIRGFGDLKLNNIKKYHLAVDEFRSKVGK